MPVYKYRNNPSNKVEFIFEIESKPDCPSDNFLPTDKKPPIEPVYLKQVHGGIVHFIGNSHDAKKTQGAIGDGIITTLKSLPISIRTADCIPILMCDEESRFVALLHGSWRSVAVGIVENTMAIITDELDILPNEIYCVMGPGILADEYEVGKFVAEKFLRSTIEKNNGRFLLDLPGEIEKRLVDFGISPAKISLPLLSTYKELWLPSYRRDGAKAGRIKAIAWIA